MRCSKVNSDHCSLRSHCDLVGNSSKFGLDIVCIRQNSFRHIFAWQDLRGRVVGGVICAAKLWAADFLSGKICQVPQNVASICHFTTQRVSAKWSQLESISEHREVRLEFWTAQELKYSRTIATKQLHQGSFPSSTQKSPLEKVRKANQRGTPQTRSLT